LASSSNSNGILNAHTLLRLESKMRGLAQWYPAHQSLHTEGFQLIVALEGLYYSSKVS
jgi:hypothetical protein